MYLFKTLKMKLLLFILLCTILPIAIISLLIYNSAKNSILLTRKEFLQAIQNSQYIKLASSLTDLIATTKAMQSSDIILNSNVANLSRDRLSNEYKITKRKLNNFLRSIQRKEKYSDIFILDNNGMVAYSSDPSYSWKYIGKNITRIYPVNFSHDDQAVQFSNIFSDTSKDAYANFLITVPLITDTGKKIGYLAIEQSMNPIYKTLSFNTNLSRTGESILINKQGENYFIQSPFRNDPNTKINSKIDYKEPDLNDFARINGRNTLVVSRNIPDLNWILLTNIDTREIYINIEKLRNLTIFLVLILAIISSIYSWLLASYLIKRLVILSDFAKNMLQKNFSIVIDKKLLEGHDEIALLANAFNKMQQSLKDYYEALNRKISELEDANKRIHQSITYGSILQRSLLPTSDKIAQIFTDSFFIWQPRDIVGGDIYSIASVKDGHILALADCTGHSIPGAFLTMLFSSTFNQIINSENLYYPDEILNRLNILIKTLLKQETRDTESESDDGLDAAICYINTKEQKLFFSGAKLSLAYVENENLQLLEADKQSIGYKRSKTDYSYIRHEINYTESVSFYITTDGLIDQLGDSPGKLTFGKKAFYELISKYAQKPMKEQKEEIEKAWKLHKGKGSSLDDVSVIGFRIRQSSK